MNKRSTSEEKEKQKKIFDKWQRIYLFSKDSSKQTITDLVEYEAIYRTPDESKLYGDIGIIPKKINKPQF